MLPKTVAIDGPAGSGKSTIGSLLAGKLGYIFVDSGVIYRAVAQQSLENHINIHDPKAVEEIAAKMQVSILPHTQEGKLSSRMLIQGKDVSPNLYLESINQAVPVVAAHPEVRVHIRRIQREIAKNGEIVIAGRDIGTVVLPNADLKVYLEVSLGERIRRRYNSLRHINSDISEQRIAEDLQRRDALDMSRAESPLLIPSDALVVRTDGLEPNEVVDIIYRYVLHRVSKKVITSALGSS